MQEAIFHFKTEGRPTYCRNFGHGHINYTFLITTDSGKQYILQRLNTHVFKKPVEVMENVIAVTQHIRAKVENDFEVLKFIPSMEGNYYYIDERRRFGAAMSLSAASA